MKRMRSQYVVVVLVSFGWIAACSAGRKAPSPPPTDWSASALKVAEQLADKVRAAGMACENYASADFEAVDKSYRGKIPVPAAIASCTSDDEEDLTFEVFEDAKRAREFLDTKQAFLCRHAVGAGMADFPGFPYVDGGTWVIEPDEKETADKLAGILGGKAQQIPCMPQ
jgi:hypothetical protein